MGEGEGITGQCYAIPTLNGQFEKRSLSEIKDSVKLFIEHAENNPKKRFMITAIGCGIAGFKVEEIAPMFRDCPSNCVLPNEFKL